MLLESSTVNTTFGDALIVALIGLSESFVSAADAGVAIPESTIAALNPTACNTRTGRLACLFMVWVLARGAG